MNHLMALLEKGFETDLPAQMIAIWF